MAMGVGFNRFTTFRHKPAFTCCCCVGEAPPCPANPRAEATVQAHRLLPPTVQTKAPSMPYIEVQCPFCKAWMSVAAEVLFDALPKRRLRSALQRFLPAAAA